MSTHDLPPELAVRHQPLPPPALCGREQAACDSSLRATRTPFFSTGHKNSFRSGTLHPGCNAG